MKTDHEIAIAGIRLTSMEPYRDGSRVIAFADVIANGIFLSNCVVIEREDGVLRTMPPKVADAEGRRQVRWSEPSLAKAVTAAVSERLDA